MGATGTVTHIDGDRVYAFGHPFYNFGPAAVPDDARHVYTMLPSLMRRSRSRRWARSIGTMQQDRATAIAGTLGKGPALVADDHHARLATATAADSRTFKLHLVNDQLFTPLLAYVAMFNTLGDYERQFGAATYLGQGPGARSRGHGD